MRRPCRLPEPLPERATASLSLSSLWVVLSQSPRSHRSDCLSFFCPYVRFVVFAHFLLSAARRTDALRVYQSVKRRRARRLLHCVYLGRSPKPSAFRRLRAVVCFIVCFIVCERLCGGFVFFPRTGEGILQALPKRFQRDFIGSWWRLLLWRRMFCEPENEVVLCARPLDVVSVFVVAVGVFV